MANPGDEPGDGRDDAVREASLDDRLAKAQADRAQKAPDRASMRSMSAGYRLSAELVAGVLVGGFMGFWLDRWLGTSPIFLIVLFLLGTVAGIMNVMRVSQALAEEAKQATEKDDPDHR